MLSGLCVAAPGLSAGNADVVVDRAQAGDLEGVRELLRRGSDANSAHGDGMSALHWAVRNSDAELARMLLYAGANVEARTRIGGHTPLLVAARAGDARMIEVLLEAGAEVDGATHNGTTPLMFAAASGVVAAVDALLAGGASAHSRERSYGQTALMFAAANNRVGSIERLLASGAEHCATSHIVDAASLESEDRAARARKYALAEATSEALAKLERERAKARGEEVEAQEDDTTEAVTVEDPNDGLRADDPEKMPGMTRAERRAARRAARAKAKGGEEQAEKPPRPLSYGQLVGRVGGLTALHFAARQGHGKAVAALLDGGADIDHPSDGDQTTPLLIAIINGHFDLARELLARGADPNLASQANAAPLYATINVEWAPHSFYPQPTSQKQQETTHLELLQLLIEKGAELDRRLTKKVWYTGYNFDQSGVDETGATAFWRAAQANDVEAMKLLVSHGADWKIATKVVPERRAPNGRNAGKDLEAERPKIGDDAVTSFQVAAGAGYVGNFHRNAPGGFLPAVRYFVEELGVDVNAPDSKGYTALHSAAMRGDNKLIAYLVLHGADPRAVAYSGETVADMANGPVQRIQPFPETLALLEALGSKNNDNCVSC